MQATSAQPEISYVEAPAEEEACPLFCSIVFGTDIFFCLLRMAIVAIGGFALLTLKPGESQFFLVLMEFIAGVGILVFAIPGNILLLLKHGWGHIVGGLAALATSVSVGVGVWNAIALSKNFAKNEQELVGFWIGAGFTMMLRVGVLVVYCVALFFFWRWTEQSNKDKVV